MMYLIAEKYGENAPSAVVVNAGSEPLGFINLFPFWQTDTLAVSDLLTYLIIEHFLGYVYTRMVGWKEV